MRTSQSLTKIMPALLAVKSELEAVTKSANNPFFKSKYADLNTYLAEVEPRLAKQQLVLLQPTGVDPNTGKNIVSTVIYHTSGEFVSSDMVIEAGNLDAQKMGAAVTYFRRYTLGALLGMQAEDDDGNIAAGKTTTKATSVTATSNVPKVNASESVTAVKTEAPAATTAKPSFRNRAKPAATAAPKAAASVASSSGDDI